MARKAKSDLQKDAELLARLVRRVHKAAADSGNIAVLQAAEQLHGACDRCLAAHGAALGLDVAPLSGGGPKPD